MENNHYTPTQKAILKVLGDGLPHTKEELHTCLSDELSDVTALRFHISNLRKKLEPQGMTILCHNMGRKGGFRYQWVRILTSDYDGVRLT